MMKTTTTRFHPSLSTTGAITRKMTSSFIASLFTIFLVMSSLYSTTKIVSYGTDAKQEQIVPTRAFPSNTDDMTSRLPSRRQPWSTVISSVDPSLSSTTIVTPVSASLILNRIFLFFASSQYYYIISNIISYFYSHIFFE
jgi:hypothetical protein